MLEKIHDTQPKAPVRISEIMLAINFGSIPSTPD
jgi:hypothetical protein